jgi:anthranilate synthase component 1
MKKLKLYAKSISTTNIQPTDLYQHYVGSENGFLLESYSQEEGRYSFIGKKPYERIVSTPQAIKIYGSDGKVKSLEGNPVEALTTYLKTFEALNTLELPFEGGLVGAFGYDFVRYIEALPHQNEDELGIEPVQLWVVLDFICMDHITNTLTIVSLKEDTEEGQKEAEEMLESTLTTIYETVPQEKVQLIPDGILVKKTDTLETFVEKVKKAKHYIKEGDIFQVVLSQRWCIESDQKGFDLFKELRILNPSPYLYYFNFGDFEIIGSSPEMLVKKSGHQVYTCPIAGTRRRGKTKEEDTILEKELMNDEKEKAEHVMLVDLARNDMGKISKFNSVKVSQFMEVHHYSHVMHIVSLVEGVAASNEPLEILGAFLPAGTLSGAPKIRAMEIIDELETVQRGLYGGAIGYIGFNGNMDVCITIRTMIKKENKIYLQAGAGLVADSVPELEYEECQHKVNALSKILLKEVE